MGLEGKKFQACLNICPTSGEDFMVEEEEDSVEEMKKEEQPYFIRTRFLGKQPTPIGTTLFSLTDLTNL